MKAKHLKYQLWACHDKFLGVGLQYLPKLHPRIFSHRTEAHKIIMSSRNIVFKPVFLIGCVFLCIRIYLHVFCLVKSPYLCLSQIRMPWKRAWSWHIFCTGLKPMATLRVLGTSQPETMGLAASYGIYGGFQNILPPFPGPIGKKNMKWLHWDFWPRFICTPRLKLKVCVRKSRRIFRVLSPLSPWTGGFGLWGNPQSHNVNQCTNPFDIMQHQSSAGRLIDQFQTPIDHMHRSGTTMQGSSSVENCST